MAAQNAREQLARRMAEKHGRNANCWRAWPRPSDSTIRRAVSRSTTTRTSWAPTALGGMIVAGPEGFEKGEYRKFNIKSAELTPGDDYAMMREVLTRRFARLVKEEGDPDSKFKRPDLVFDRRWAGPAFPSPAMSSRTSAWRTWRWPPSPRGRTATPAASISTCRGRSRSGSIPGVPFSITSSACATRRHRFAIGSHRKKRAKAIGANPLDEVAGIGAARKRALLQHFGSARAVASAKSDRPGIDRGHQQGDGQKKSSISSTPAADSGVKVASC